MEVSIVCLLYVINFTLAKNINTDIQSTTVYPLLATTTTTTINKRISNNEIRINDREVRRMIMENDDSRMMKEEEKAVNVDPWAGYYDFIINEGSFKFWAAFQLGSAILLIYSAFAAVYYAKFNPVASDDDYYDDFFFRSNGRSVSDQDKSWFGLDAQTVQQIINAITSDKYS